MVALWVFFMVDCSGGYALAVTLLFLIFFFFFILRCSKHCKIFSDYFSEMQTNTRKTIIFLEIIYIYKHFTVENVLR